MVFLCTIFTVHCGQTIKPTGYNSLNTKDLSFFFCYTSQWTFAVLPLILQPNWMLHFKRLMAPTFLSFFSTVLQYRFPLKSCLRFFFCFTRLGSPANATPELCEAYQCFTLCWPILNIKLWTNVEQKLLPFFPIHNSSDCFKCGFILILIGQWIVSKHCSVVRQSIK